MANRNDYWILALISTSVSQTPSSTRVTNKLKHITAFEKSLLALLFHTQLSNTIYSKNVLSNPNSRDVHEHSNMRCATETSVVQNAITIDKQQLWP
jgi:hypothetical protein